MVSRMLPCFAAGLTKPYVLFFALKQYVVDYGLFRAPVKGEVV
jgi:hypothetical protein